MKVRVEIPDKLVEKLELILIARSLSLDEVVRLYLRALVSSSERMAPLGLMAEMPFGKFKGEELGVIIRADPDYVSWLVGNSAHFKLSPEALALLETVTAVAETPAKDKKLKAA
jgi:hypothetical protein